MSRKGIGNSPAASAFGDIQAGCVRAQPAMHIARTISGLGADPEQVLAGAGIPADLFANPENTISLQALGNLLERCVAATGCEHFGLLLGAAADDNPLGLLGEIIEQCADVGTAIAHIHQYFHVHDRGGMATRTVAGRDASIGYALLDATGPGVDQINDAAIAIGMGLMRRLCGPNWKPTAVLLPRRRPRDVRPYENVFACTPEFAAERAALIFPAGNLRRRIAGADREKYALLAERLRTVARQSDLDFAEQVRRVVRGLVAVRRCSLDEVATLFAMNRRRINRRLERQGTTFHRISQEALRDLAERLMRDTDMTLGEISAALDYAEAGVFTRAFRGWRGVAPSEWRRTHAPDRGPAGG
ncbi:MAG: AraC family transcriptional regulator [Burkholderiales bacterium]|nr:AraC family transcriptional regulator [Burkholderiales bacterium]